MDSSEIKGYTDQNERNKALVNANKIMEEIVLRQFDNIAADANPGAVDIRWFSIGRTHIEQGFMALNRAIFQPQRIELDEDKEPEIASPPAHIGQVFRVNDPKNGKDVVFDRDPTDPGAKELVADGAHWYRREEHDAYRIAKQKRQDETNVNKTKSAIASKKANDTNP